jgi:hypothetical protein
LTRHVLSDRGGKARVRIGGTCLVLVYMPSIEGEREAFQYNKLRFCNSTC